MGVLRRAALVGSLSVAIAFVALGQLEETYGKNLDFVE